MSFSYPLHVAAPSAAKTAPPSKGAAPAPGKAPAASPESPQKAKGGDKSSKKK
ncbi:hypothetical protein PAXRUDRAFT_8404 [Paxillus rubicundulus Ve08.2h10]|uniref:Uncharacterized protein n=1 Tax=Paxillus rubicundulus Ve08.2h10 TaxID=930991 RepID=A0A0D0E5U7_9AGAM|nr:hypothetical protein PAXRUDRAFT_8404 [Paxillus rubicundulus Ve08.2h10]